MAKKKSRARTGETKTTKATRAAGGTNAKAAGKTPSQKKVVTRRAAGDRGKSASGERRVSLRDYCRSLPGTTEDIKWGDNLIFSVGGKMYAGFPMLDEKQFAFKCDDDDYDRLTETDGIIPAPYSARESWVKFLRRDAVPEDELLDLLRKAHRLIASKLPKYKQRELAAMGVELEV